jgi:hypothetical protein
MGSKAWQCLPLRQERTCKSLIIEIPKLGTDIAFKSGEYGNFVCRDGDLGQIGEAAEFFEGLTAASHRPMAV